MIFSYIYACVSFVTAAAEAAAIGEDLIIIRHPHNNSPVTHSVTRSVSQSVNLVFGGKRVPYVLLFCVPAFERGGGQTDQDYNIC